MAEVQALVSVQLQRAGASAASADSTARALVLAESQGLGSHGLSRVSQYTAHLRNGRANGAALPQVLRRKGELTGGDADGGWPASGLLHQPGGRHPPAARSGSVDD